MITNRQAAGNTNPIITAAPPLGPITTGPDLELPFWAVAPSACWITYAVTFFQHCLLLCMEYVLGVNPRWYSCSILPAEYSGIISHLSIQSNQGYADVCLFARYVSLGTGSGAWSWQVDSLVVCHRQEFRAHGRTRPIYIVPMMALLILLQGLGWYMTVHPENPAGLWELLVNVALDNIA